MDSSNTLLPEISDRHISDFISVAGEENVLTDYDNVEKLSKDFYWYSPILKKQLENKQADIAIKVSSLEELKGIVSICAKNRLPITLRGGGTGNYGQCIPLYRGVVIDITAMELVDSFMARVLNDTATMVHLLGAQVVITGMQPAVAITLIEMGRELIGVQTALDLDQGIETVQLMIEEGSHGDQR